MGRLGETWGNTVNGTVLGEDCERVVFILNDVASENDAPPIRPKFFAELAVFYMAKVHKSHNLSLGPDAINAPSLASFWLGPLLL